MKITHTWNVLPMFSRNFPPAKITTFTVSGTTLSLYILIFIIVYVWSLACLLRNNFTFDRTCMYIFYSYFIAIEEAKDYRNLPWLCTGTGKSTQVSKICSPRQALPSLWRCKSLTLGRISLSLYKVVVDYFSPTVLIPTTKSHQGSHTPFWDWGQGPLALGKIAAFCLELGKNNKTYFVIHILVSFNMFKCTCTFIHTVLLEIHLQFHVLFYSNLSFFPPFFQFFLKESNWENLGSKLGKNILFCIGNGAHLLLEKLLQNAFW